MLNKKSKGFFSVSYILFLYFSDSSSLSFPVIQYFSESLKILFAALPFLVFPYSKLTSISPVCAESSTNRVSLSVLRTNRRAQSMGALSSTAMEQRQVNSVGSELMWHFSGSDTQSVITHMRSYTASAAVYENAGGLRAGHL